MRRLPSGVSTRGRVSVQNTYGARFSASCQSSLPSASLALLAAHALAVTFVLGQCGASVKPECVERLGTDGGGRSALAYAVTVAPKSRGRPFASEQNGPLWRKI